MELEEVARERNRFEQWVLWRSRGARPHGSQILDLLISSSGIWNPESRIWDLESRLWSLESISLVGSPEGAVQP